MENFKSVQEALNKVASVAGEMHEVLQDPFFESLALTKKAALDRKLSARQSTTVGRVYLGFHLACARPVDGRREFVHLGEDFLLDPPKDVPKGSVFLLLNNDVAKHVTQYIDYFNSNPDAIFVIWDWDSQHWVYMSSLLALNSDFYLTATSENAYLLSHFNPYYLGPVFAAVHQWTRRFIIEHIELFMQDRSNEPLGMHVFYQKYPRRNRAVATVSKTYPTVGFGNNDYKARSEMDNFREWAQHKTHWIMPVLAGVPIRVYNAMITGGIPVLPAVYKILPEVAILGDVPLYYEVADLIEPKMINEAAVARFDAGGESGLVARISDAIENHHVDSRCEHIFRALENVMDKIARADRSHDLGYLGIPA